jgi:hypothetical protein
MSNALPDLQQAHRHFAADCFNRAWTYIDNPDRTAADDEQMILLSLASLWHWTQRDDCEDRHRSIGHWQASRVYALADQPDNAMHHAERSLVYAADLPPFFVAYAHEAIARAALLQDDHDHCREQLVKARSLVASIASAQDKALIESDIDELEAKL